MSTEQSIGISQLDLESSFQSEEKIVEKIIIKEKVSTYIIRECLEIIKPNNDKFRRCVKCVQEFKISSGRKHYGYSNLKRHLEGSHKIYFNEPNTTKVQTLDSFVQKKKVTKRNDAFASILFSLACNSFSITKNPTLLAAFKALNSDFVPLEARTLKIKMKETQIKLEVYILNKLKDKSFVLVHDHWSDRRISITGVVIVSEQKSYLMKTIVTKSQTAKDIEEGLSSYINELNELNLIPVGLVSDSAPNVLAANRVLNSKYGTSSIGCVAHQINLATKNVFDEHAEVSNACIGSIQIIFKELIDGINNNQEVVILEENDEEDEEDCYLDEVDENGSSRI
uniref:DUF659 domain-containing protein n=1 Tax=Rhabditophanes sp. KR3021 TaxID=114890 RepID=A0AC35UI61_9BILA